ncbi:MAG: HD domain-containing protein [Gemmatimonadota bacterium]|nr:HD domain-containing protein [Gemmatimonadota bacterium]MDH5761055.1 HD domain-containing protein [Gemmatimonadota bacterium]
MPEGPRPGTVTGESKLNLQEEGRKVLGAFYSALNALKLYPVENATVQQALDELHSLVTRVVKAEAGAELRVVGDFFFLNETRLRLDLSNFATFGSFARALQEHGIGAVEILPGIRRDEWAPFIAMLLRKPQTEDPFENFQIGFDQTPVEHMELRPEKDVQEPEHDEEALTAAKRTYAQSVKAAKDALGDVRLGKAVNVRKVKRAVQGIVDQVISNEPSIVTMTTLRDFDEYTFTHCVNVCIFSVIIGTRLGMTKQQLYELGLGALFHDIGKQRVGVEIINKTGGLTDEEWNAIKEHTTEGLLVLFKMHGFADVPYRQMLIAYEHHMKVDLTGYPPKKRDREPTLFTRIVAVADAFDAGTSVRSYQHKPWPPDSVLQEMRDNPRRGFDTLVVKALISATGVYPVGTLAILDSHELAVVSHVNPDPNLLHRPKVKVISDAMGVPLSQPITLDLSQNHPTTGQPIRSIIKTTDPQKYGIRVSDYLI